MIILLDCVFQKGKEKRFKCFHYEDIISEETGMFYYSETLHNVNIYQNIK